MVSERAVLQQLAVESVAEAERVGKLLDLSTSNVQDVLQTLEEDGFVHSEDDYWYLTSTGEERLAELCRDRFTDPELSQLRQVFDPFEDCDRRMKQLASEWQAEERSLERTADELAAIHHDMATLFETCDEPLATAYMSYVESLEEALELFSSGETDYFTGTDVRSYHNVWFRLHDDLLRTLDENRTD